MLGKALKDENKLLFMQGPPGKKMLHDALIKTYFVVSSQVQGRLKLEWN